ncbi:MAG: 4Fe-4S binding protein [Zetaproteobacteria bacterium]|nr:4Fe-4S binding protein [Zetaproteobacteria bacterium]
MRSPGEKVFLIFFFPTVIGFYLIYKYPLWFVAADEVESSFYWLGKSTSFWYNTVYSGLVCFISARVILSNKTPYGKNKQAPLSSYQKKKFTSIFFAQLIFFYLIPFYLPYLFNDKNFFQDTYAPLNKNAYVYVYNGFTSLSGFLYVFIVVPISVWFLGKRYCSWFCACGNLAEAIGVTKLGNKWVTQHTPRGQTSLKLEKLQYAFLVFAIFFGLLLFFDTWKIVTAPNLVQSVREVQDFAVDLMFGALIGVGAYPLLGTRIWCRYGCPLAGGMRLFGKFSKSRFKVVANKGCKGLNLCSTQCPMGIDVASYAHENKVPTQGSFGLQNSPCIGCGGCVDICPVKALSFQKVLNPTP